MASDGSSPSTECFTKKQSHNYIESMTTSDTELGNFMEYATLNGLWVKHVENEPEAAIITKNELQNMFNMFWNGTHFTKRESYEYIAPLTTSGKELDDFMEYATQNGLWGWPGKDCDIEGVGDIIDEGELQTMFNIFIDYNTQITSD